MNIFKRYSAFVLVVISVLLLTACSRTFIVKPSGSLGGEITFHFYKKVEDTVPSKFNIVDLVVQKKVSAEKWEIVWELKGEQSLDSIVYGKKHKNLKEVVSAEPLKKGVQYRILASETSYANPIGYAGVEFSFDDSGNIVVSGS